MLTPTDIHLLVGVCSQMSHPSDVSITLGEMVYDEASDRKRDVDVTIKFVTPEGDTGSFIGIEVKDEKRKLGSQQVEQLCMKFRDMPNIKTGGIVSSSGFTGPAIKKAKFHGVKLYEFRRWEIEKEVEHLAFHDEFTVTESVYQARENYLVTFDVEETLSEEEKASFGKMTAVFIDESLETMVDIDTHLLNILAGMLNDSSIRNAIDQCEPQQALQVDSTISFAAPFYIRPVDRSYAVHKAQFQGEFEKVVRRYTPEFKALVDLDTHESIGMAIHEGFNGCLYGVAAVSADRTIRSVLIPVDNRNLNRIHELKIQ